MNEKHAIALIGTLAVIASTMTITTVAYANKETPTKEVPVPGPTVTEKEVREHKIPVPGPTVTKKVVETKTVRPPASRSNERKTTVPPKKTQAPAVPSGSARDIARQVFGSQFTCADALINKESSWNVQATNPSSGAYGLPQALPGSKMASHGSDWQSNPATQLRWMKTYVDSRYGGICGAWNHSQKNNWY